jgi:hypothetical protein
VLLSREFNETHTHFKKPQTSWKLYKPSVIYIYIYIYLAPFFLDRCQRNNLPLEKASGHSPKLPWLDNGLASPLAGINHRIDWLTSLFQLQKLCSIKLDGKMAVNHL